MQEIGSDLGVSGVGEETEADKCVWQVEDDEHLAHRHEHQTD